MSISGNSFNPADLNTKVQGVLVGIVSDNKDPDALGRVKVKLPIREGTEDTDWVRIATLMAGKDRGSLFIPEVGDEVLVAFHLGDISVPYVIGALWNDKNKGPKEDDKNNIRQFKSRSGHELIFDDTSGDEKFIIKTKKGHKLEFTDKNDTIKLTDANGTNVFQIEGGSKNEVTVKSQSSEMKMTAKGDITISSPKSLTLKSAQIVIEASATLSIKGNAKVDVESSGMLTVKGSMVKIN